VGRSVAKGAFVILGASLGRGVKPKEVSREWGDEEADKAAWGGDLDRGLERKGQSCEVEYITYAGRRRFGGGPGPKCYREGR